jgi:hypothetical protein
VEFLHVVDDGLPLFDMSWCCSSGGLMARDEVESEVPAAEERPSEILDEGGG